MILHDNLPADGNGNSPAPVTSQASPAPPPPSATIVVEGAKTERELELEQELEVARTEKFTTVSQKEKLEREIAYLQDELARLRAIPASPAPATAEMHWTKTFLG